MSLNFSELRVALYELINGLTQKPVIWNNQNAPTPDGEFISMRISNFQKLGATDYVGQPDGTGNSPTAGDRELQLSLQATSDNAMNILIDLLDKLELATTIELLISKNIAYVSAENVNDISLKIGERFETKAAVDLLFRVSKNYSSETLDNTNFVEEISIDSTIGDIETDFTIDDVETEIIIN